METMPRGKDWETLGRKCVSEAQEVFDGRGSGVEGTTPAIAAVGVC